MSFVIKTERVDEGHNGIEEMSRASRLPSNDVTKYMSIKEEMADDVTDSSVIKQESANDDVDGESGDGDESGDYDDSDSSDDDESHDAGVHKGDIVKVKDESGNLVFEFIKQEKLDENEDKVTPDDKCTPGDKYTPEDECTPEDNFISEDKNLPKDYQSRCDGAPSDGRTGDSSLTSATHTDDSLKVGAVRVFLYTCILLVCGIFQLL